MRSIRSSLSIVLITLFSLPSILLAQSFAEREKRSLAEPFTGVRTSDGIAGGLFKIEQTGVSTAPILEAASSFLESLTDEQRSKTLFPVDDEEWRRWCNVDTGIYKRQGLSLLDMDEQQKRVARELLRVSLSAKGLELTDAIRKTDHTLWEISNGNPIYDEELYFFTIMGEPSIDEPWGWQLDGHHLVINYFVLGDQVVMAPAFIGGEPIHTKTGKYKGNIILQDEQDAGLALAQSLTEKQRKLAIINSSKRRNQNRAEAFRDNLIIDFQGIPATDLDENQRTMLLELIELYVGNMRDGHARIKMEEIKGHFDQTWFAWVGETKDDSVFYYRIHSPVIYIEFDHQNPIGTRGINTPGQPTRDHIHTVIRTPNGNDYGKDLLRQHLEQHPH
ncbi:MAG: DUF3500 domain-containing protein [Puniceicoccaceae bacterium]